MIIKTVYLYLLIWKIAELKLPKYEFNIKILLRISIARAAAIYDIFWFDESNGMEWNSKNVW